MLPDYVKKNDTVLFIPYTTDIPQLRLGVVEEDFYGKLFIAYRGIYCDNGEWYICKKDSIKDHINEINRKLNYAIREYIKAKEDKNKI